jgi:phospholipase C
MTFSRRALSALVVAAGLSACGGGAGSGQGPAPSALQTSASSRPTTTATATKPPGRPKATASPTAKPTASPTPAPTGSPLGAIKHVVLIVQENRSVDNLFQGYPGANTVASGQISTGLTVQLVPIPIHVGFDVSHGLPDFLAACDGGPQGINCRNDAFDRERLAGQSMQPYPAYSYVPQSDTQLYFQLARQYVLADNNFQSHVDASFVGHQYLIAAQAQHAVDLPHGVWGCPANVATITATRTIGPLEKACWTEPTLASELDAKQLSWKMYAPNVHDAGFNWVAFRAIKPVFDGPEWKTNISKPNTNILIDIKSGSLPAMSWVIPTFAESDHEGAGDQNGENWVSTVVNALGISQYWNSTAVIVVWDDWGGFYDHVPPQYLDYDGLGFRTPILVISPFAKHNYVSHVQYEFGSIDQFVEDVFGLGRLAASDTRANSLIPDCFDFSQTRRIFRQLHTTISAAQFVRDAQVPTPSEDVLEAGGD